MARRFRDREEAGRLLAERLTHLAGAEPVIEALPRGGLPVAAEVARALDAPLDVILVRKLGVPYQPELAMGAIGEDGVRVVDDDILAMAQVTEDELVRVEARERVELERRSASYRAHRPRVPIDGRTVVIVDDGIATGSTARAAVQVARQHGASRVVLAIPVAPPDSVAALASVADDVVAVATPEPFRSVGGWYRDFGQVTDAEVEQRLRASLGDETSGSPAVADDPVDDEVSIPANGHRLAGHLTVPGEAVGMVLFAHGSGSSRHSPRNHAVAAALHGRRLGTLLFDLLTDDEASDRRNVFDVDLLARRLVAADDWLRGSPQGGELPVGYFGASTGAAAALVAAARTPDRVGAVVSRGGRPDLAGQALAHVRAPTLLIVGGADEIVVDLNRRAAAQLRCPHDIAVVPNATHLFEEPGALDEVADLAGAWFIRHLPGPAA